MAAIIKVTIKLSTRPSVGPINKRSHAHVSTSVSLEKICRKLISNVSRDTWDNKQNF
jgi:hypothetical protein